MKAPTPRSLDVPAPLNRFSSFLGTRTPALVDPGLPSAILVDHQSDWHEGLIRIEFPFASAWVGRGGASGVSGVQKGVMAYHVVGHVVRPLKDLWSNVHQEGVRRPTAEDHDLMDRVTRQE